MMVGDIDSHERPPGRDLSTLLERIALLGGDEELLSALAELDLGDDVPTVEIVRTAAELAIARERMRVHTSPPEPIEAAFLARRSFVQKLDDARAAADLAANASGVFDELLRSHDQRVVEAALLAMGESVAKELKPTLRHLQQHSGDARSQAVHELTTYLLVHGDADV